MKKTDRQTDKEREKEGEGKEGEGEGGGRKGERGKGRERERKRDIYSISIQFGYIQNRWQNCQIVGEGVNQYVDTNRTNDRNYFSFRHRIPDTIWHQNKLARTMCNNARKEISMILKNAQLFSCLLTHSFSVVVSLPLKTQYSTLIPSLFIIQSWRKHERLFLKFIKSADLYPIDRKRLDLPRNVRSC